MPVKKKPFENNNKNKKSSSNLKEKNSNNVENKDSKKNISNEKKDLKNDIKKINNKNVSNKNVKEKAINKNALNKKEVSNKNASNKNDKEEVSNKNASNKEEVSNKNASNKEEVSNKNASNKIDFTDVKINNNAIDNNAINNLNPNNIPGNLSILPLFDVALFPKMILPLVVMQVDSIKLVDDAMASNRIIGFVSAKQNEMKEEYLAEDIYDIGTSALILKMGKGEDNASSQLLVQGLKRFKIKKYNQLKPYMIAEIEIIEDTIEEDIETKAFMSNIVGLFSKIVELSPILPKEFASMAQSIAEPGTLVDMAISTINCSIEEKQKILEAVDIKERLKLATQYINDQLEIVKLGNKIQSQVKGDIDKNQREYFLRHQLKTIKDELGESEDQNVEIEEYKNKIQNNKLPEDAKKEALREISRLEKMHPSSSEYTVSSTYLDWLTTLPWNISSKESLDIAKAKQILNNDHYGLEKAKKRIIEYLAVRKLKPDSKGPILCFVGPPGTGKTSLGRSISKAIGRKFIRVSLGGLRDEAEIRGHRRTYVGALPGRIIQGIRRANTNNPVFMLDEIDKVGADFRGDPSAALLEVLDPEQNAAFSDHYLDIPFDLSNVMFITTANILDTIPPALKDRMEVLKLSGYTEEEKIKISTKFLIPRQRAAHGLKSTNIKFSNSSIKCVIDSYTREAGVRNLEREIAAICRNVASNIAQKKIKSQSITVENAKKILGTIKYKPEFASRFLTPGLCTGLAWTQSGGEILFVEAAIMKGEKKLTLTGQLGDVMKESATTALSFIRSHAQKFNINEDFFEKNDIHIHIPSGAIPKDGPSAGVTLLTSLVSLLTNRNVKNELAMTGEITLRGQVLEVGGIKEKVLAAHRAGIKEIILPKDNEKDMEDISKNIQKSIKFIFMDKMLDVVNTALNDKPDISNNININKSDNSVNNNNDIISPEENILKE